jgi:hypothetical protein
MLRSVATLLLLLLGCGATTTASTVLEEVRGRCLGALAASDANADGTIDLSEYPSVLELMSPATTCPDKWSVVATTEESYFRDIFTSLSCTCQRYAVLTRDQSCCDVATLYLPGKYPTSYTINMCITLAHALIAECGETMMVDEAVPYYAEDAAAPTESPTALILEGAIDTLLSSPIETVLTETNFFDHNNSDETEDEDEEGEPATDTFADMADEDIDVTKADKKKKHDEKEINKHVLVWSVIIGALVATSLFFWVRMNRRTDDNVEKGDGEQTDESSDDVETGCSRAEEEAVVPEAETIVVPEAPPAELPTDLMVGNMSASARKLLDGEEGVGSKAQKVIHALLHGQDDVSSIASRSTTRQPKSAVGSRSVCSVLGRSTPAPLAVFDDLSVYNLEESQHSSTASGGTESIHSVDFPSGELSGELAWKEFLSSDQSVAASDDAASSTVGRPRRSSPLSTAPKKQGRDKNRVHSARTSAKPTSLFYRLRPMDKKQHKMSENYAFSKYIQNTLEEAEITGMRQKVSI